MLFFFLCQFICRLTQSDSSCSPMDGGMAPRSFQLLLGGHGYFMSGAGECLCVDIFQVIWQHINAGGRREGRLLEDSSAGQTTTAIVVIVLCCPMN